MSTSSTSLPLDDIQNIILRGNGMDFARFFALRVNDVAAAKRALGNLAAGDPQSGLRVADSGQWTSKPDYVLNLGITYQGLAALDLPTHYLSTFPAEFQSLTADRSAAMGDVEASAPANWLPAYAPTPAGSPPVHLLLILWGRSPEALEARTQDVEAVIGEGDAFAELCRHDGQSLPGEVIHFGFTDGISQPQVKDGPAIPCPSPNNEVATGEFVLGYADENGSVATAPQPDALGRNGGYGAFRILKQDVDAFDAFLSAHGPQTDPPPGVDPRDWLAAKVCGRWRNGVPLALSPETPCPNPPIPEDGLDDFQYLPDDPRGVQCPIGSHLRRANPRDGRVAGGSPSLHRIIRRGIAYGPPYDPAHPHDGIERGLLGMFVCASLKYQFEFLMSQWLNGDSFGLGGDLDVIQGDNGGSNDGNNDPDKGHFVVPLATGRPIAVTGFGRFVITRASAYCFFPSFTAMKYLATM